MITLDTKNKIADQFVYSHLSKLEEITKPLKSFGITHFSYNKFIGKDKFILLCPQILTLRERFGHSLDRDYIVHPQLDLIRQNTKFLLWQNFPPDNPILETLQEFNINHGITLFRKTEEDICESFHFATTNDNELISDCYLNNLSILDVFSDYFVNEMSDIINHQSPGKLTQIKNSLIISEESHKDALSQKQS
ncbi:MAG: hypothetical protein ACOH2E_00920 [Candidatus Paracaedibacter sp.]